MRAGRGPGVISYGSWCGGNGKQCLPCCWSTWHVYDGCHLRQDRPGVRIKRAFYNPMTLHSAASAQTKFCEKLVPVRANRAASLSSSCCFSKMPSPSETSRISIASNQVSFAIPHEPFHLTHDAYRELPALSLAWLSSHMSLVPTFVSAS